MNTGHLLNKERIALHLSDIAQQVQEGDIDPIDGYIELYEVKKIAEEMIQVIQDDAINRAEDLDCDHVQKGYHVQVKTRTNYSYKNSPKWHQYKEQLKNLEAQMKFAASHGELAKTEDGEVIEPAEVKTSTFITLTYKGE